jgi:hypothetical protein
MPESATIPSPAAAPETPASPTTNLNTALAGFDALVAPEPPPETPPETQSETAPETTTETPPVTAPPEKAGESGQPPPPENQTPPAAPTGKVKAPTLREMLERTRNEATDWKTKFEKLSEETKKPKPDPEKEQLLKDREAWNKTRAELEEELRYAKYERTTEYKQQYQEPFVKAYDAAQKLVEGLNFKLPGEVDEITGETKEAVRKATADDWKTLMSINDEDAANKFIADHFGHNAARVSLQRDKVLDLFGKMNSAVEEFRQRGAERETEIQKAATQAQKQVSEQFHAANARAAEKYPQLFAPDPADARGNELLATGQRLTDLAFGVLDPSEIDKLPASIREKLVNGRLPPGEMTLLHSAIRNRSAAYDRLVYRLNQKDAALKAAEEKLKGYEKSEPGRGEERRVAARGPKAAPQSFDDIDAEFDRLAAGNG